jgi:UTP-glucose-1-phosphate uridylyltransferase
MCQLWLLFDSSHVGLGDGIWDYINTVRDETFLVLYKDQKFDAFFVGLLAVCSENHTERKNTVLIVNHVVGVQAAG